jgi:hypothetical protein
MIHANLDRGASGATLGAARDSRVTELHKARRELIDLVAETRSRAVRIALFGALLHRPDPDGNETEDERAKNLKVLLDTQTWIQRVADLLETGRDPWGDLPDPVCAWLKTFVKQMPEITRQMQRMAEVSTRVAEAAQSAPSDLGEALRQHFDARRNGFMATITAFCDSLWHSMDTERDAEVARARETVETTLKAIKRIEEIAKHVRLVSINTSIEASKLAERGAGIGFIAAEFKSLAEELQDLSGTVREDVSTLSQG